MIFHKLLQYRAIAAAMQLYEQLITIGVHLRQSDVLMMLQNLPYEHITILGDQVNNVNSIHSTYEHNNRAKIKQTQLK